MAVIGWGKPRIFFKDLDATNSEWQEMPTPEENTTELSTEKGDKQEAKIEGGENEDVRYNKNTYALACTVRAAKGRVCPIENTDGVNSHNFAVAVQPEDPAVQGMAFLKSRASVEDTFTTEEGGKWNITFDAIKHSADMKQIYWGVIEATESGGKITQVTVNPEDNANSTADKLNVATGAIVTA